MWIVFGETKVVRPKTKVMSNVNRREAIDNVIVKRKEDTE